MPTIFFIVLWVVLWGLHGACAVILIASARLYWYLENPYLVYFADLVAQPEGRYFRLFGTALGFLGGCHALEWLRMTIESVRMHKPTVPSVGSVDAFIGWLKCYVIPPVHRATRTLARKFTQKPRSRRHSFSTRFASRSLQSSQELMKRGSEVFSIRSSRFEAIFVFREIVVTISQTYQCYISSSRISKPSIHNLSVGLVAANCFTIALLYPLLIRNEATFRSNTARISSSSCISMRLLCHILDGMWTFALSVVLPLAIIMPYIDKYDAERFTFSDDIFYSDTKFTELIQMSQALLARTFIDGLYKLVPHVSMYLCLVVIASVMRDQHAKARIVASARNSDTTTHIRVLPDKMVEADPKLKLSSGSLNHDLKIGTSPPQPSLPERPQQAVPCTSGLQRKAIPAMFILFAVAVTAIHMRAMVTNPAGATAGTSVSLMCALPVYPWISSGASCSVIIYNCYRHEVDTPPVDVFDVLDHSLVLIVIFMHCPGIVVPPSIQGFVNLHAIEIYNSTLVEWSAEAALSDVYHPHMIYFTLALVNMTELPPGVLQTPFPRTLTAVEISKTNLSTLPANLPEVWNNVELVFLEHSLLTEAPRELFLLPSLNKVSLIDNHITALPDDFSDVMQGNDYFLMLLSSNPLSSLPPDLRPDLFFGFLALEHTNLSGIPDWAFSHVYMTLYLFGSPLCSLPTENPSVEAGCSVQDINTDGAYPLSLVIAKREV